MVSQKETDNELTAATYMAGATDEDCVGDIIKLFGHLHIASPSPSIPPLPSVHDGAHYYNTQEQGVAGSLRFQVPSYIPPLLEKPHLCGEFDSSLSSVS